MKYISSPKKFFIQSILSNPVIRSKTSSCNPVEFFILLIMSDDLIDPVETRGTIWVLGAWNGLGRDVAAWLTSFGASVVRDPDYHPDELESLSAWAASIPDISHIIYCGAVFDPDRRESRPGEFHRWMIDIPLLLSKIADERHARLVVVVSGQVFSGELKSRGYGESYRRAPINELGRLQVQTEDLIRAANPDALIVRTGWLYGASPNAFESSTLFARLDNALQAGGQVLVPECEIISPTFTKNLALALFDFAVLDWYPTVRADLNAPWIPIVLGGVYHYSDAGEASIAEFARAYYARAKARCDACAEVEVIERPAESFPDRAPHPKRLVLATQVLLRKVKPMRRQPWQDALNAWFLAFSPVPRLFFTLHGEKMRGDTASSQNRT